MSKRLFGALLIVRVFTPLIIFLLIFLSGYQLISEIKNELDEEIIIVTQSIGNTKQEITNVQNNIEEVAEAFTQINQSLSSALKPIDNALKALPNWISLSTNFDANLNIARIFDPIFTPLNNIKSNTEKVVDNIDNTISPIVNSVDILKQALIKWIRNMIILITILMLLLANYLFLPFLSDFKRGISLLFGSNNN
ncbi:MAG: hypothetical protein AB4062_10895 [Crocosphaera sp.]